MDVTIDNTYACESTAGVSSGSTHMRLQDVSASCLLGDLTTSGSFQITWDGGQRSTLRTSGIVTRPGSQTIVAFTGSITAGLFAGATVVGETTMANPGLADCLSDKGATSVTGLGTLTIIDVLR
ncbi:hypothetical protein [Amycolatopsis sp. cmx-11-12]|uniref:hypothetical protein n=1 Tax=Amycolatopsis sp. cmx-11-12 TaxID=2785795 RepID=UPI0039185C3B